MLRVAREAAETLEQEDGVGSDVIDLLTVAPLDRETIVRSVSKTGRAVIVHEAPRSFGPGAEVAASIMDGAFLSLEAPIARVTTHDVPFPGFAREKANLPDVPRLGGSARATLATKPTGKQAADPLDPTRTLAPEPRTTVEGTRARQAPAAESPRAPARSFEPAETRAAVDVGAPARSGPVPATPSTRRLSRELGVDLHAVRGTGPGGRVTDDDVRAAVAGGAPASAQARGVPRTDRAAQLEPAATPAPAKPLAMHVTEPPLPNFEQWGPVER